MEENATLIAETNVLRAELKIEEKKTKKMESILGLSNKYMLPKVAQKMMSDAVATRAEIEEEFRVELMVRKIWVVFGGVVFTIVLIPGYGIENRRFEGGEFQAAVEDREKE